MRCFNVLVYLGRAFYFLHYFSFCTGALNHFSLSDFNLTDAAYDQGHRSKKINQCLPPDSESPDFFQINAIIMFRLTGVTGGGR